MFPKFEDIAIGTRASLQKLIGIEDIKKFVEMTGDNNPLHMDPSFADRTSFKEVVVHGMLGASFISTVIGTKLPGDGALWMSQSMEFLLPVRLGDDLLIICEVLKKHERDRILELKTEIFNQHGQQVLRGEAKVKVLLVALPELKAAPGVRPKTALVTGGAGGIGATICEKLGQMGMRIVVNYHSNSLAAGTLVDKLHGQGVEAIAVKADVSRKGDVTEMFRAIQQKFGGVDVLVHNASSKIIPKSIDDTTQEDLFLHFNTQVVGMLNLVHNCLPHMKAHQFGKIVTILSQVLDGDPTAQWTSYTVGKASLRALSQCLAKELGPLGISVNSVSPSLTDTKFVGDLSEKSKLIIARQTPVRRLCTPSDVANAVSFLASPEASFLNGETIRINGGKIML